jgi:hypothetical protein
VVGFLAGGNRAAHPPGSPSPGAAELPAAGSRTPAAARSP